MEPLTCALCSCLRACAWLRVHGRRDFTRFPACRVTKGHSQHAHHAPERTLWRTHATSDANSRCRCQPHATLAQQAPTQGSPATALEAPPPLTGPHAKPTRGAQSRHPSATHVGLCALGCPPWQSRPRLGNAASRCAPGRCSAPPATGPSRPGLGLPRAVPHAHELVLVGHVPQQVVVDVACGRTGAAAAQRTCVSACASLSARPRPSTHAEDTHTRQYFFAKTDADRSMLPRADVPSIGPPHHPAEVRHAAQPTPRPSPSGCLWLGLYVHSLAPPPLSLTRVRQHAAPDAAVQLHALRKAAGHRVVLEGLRAATATA